MHGSSPKKKTQNTAESVELIIRNPEHMVVILEYLEHEALRLGLQFSASVIGMAAIAVRDETRKS